MIVSYVSNKKFYKYMVVSLYSLLSKNNNIDKVYLICEDDRIDDIDKLRNVVDEYNNVEFCLICLDKFIENYLNKNSLNYNNYYSNYCFGKLLLANIISEDKVLYLDVDTIISSDISNIWKYNIDSYYCAGVKDFAISYRGNLNELGINDKYINSGVVVFNLDKIRKDGIVDRMFDVINRRKLMYPDQDALNIVCQYDILYLPNIYNVTYDVTLKMNNYSLAKIYHFAGKKPDGIINRPFGEEWAVVQEEFNNKFGWE